MNETNESKVELNGRQVFFSSAVVLMDDDLREYLHSQIAPCGDQEFLDAYAEAHLAKFGEEFQVN